MLSIKVRQIAKKLKELSIEEQQWLLQQLLEQIAVSEDTGISQIHPLGMTKKTFNITAAVPGSGLSDTVIKHDEILVKSILGE